MSRPLVKSISRLAFPLISGGLGIGVSAALGLPGGVVAGAAFEALSAAGFFSAGPFDGGGAAWTLNQTSVASRSKHREIKLDLNFIGTGDSIDAGKTSGGLVYPLTARGTVAIDRWNGDRVSLHDQMGMVNTEAGQALGDALRQLTVPEGPYLYSVEQGVGGLRGTNPDLMG